MIIFPKEDLPLLDYIEDDGLKVEPKYYVPIVPMVLINGMNGIGTGFSTNIPCFNPIDICDNIKNILKHKDFTEMEPWFRGFTGTIIKTGEKTFMSKGKYKILDHNTMEITELPIGRWTEDYKEVLNKLVIERGDKETKQKIIVDYENQSTDKQVYFKIHLKTGYLTSAQWSEGDIDRIEKDFKLTTTKNTNLTNIHLYNENNTITKYNSIEDIMREYVRVRLDMYKKRKEHQLNELDKTIQIISSKCKFILEIIDETIIIQKRSKENIQDQLSSKGYQLINDSYDYLVKLPIYTLSEDEISKLMKQKDDLIEEYNTLQEKSIENLWLDELSIFEKMYKRFVK
tara:strand:- start:137 stop:1165 length:1029 start_codon:yes stop_codon:yes gene_type:complete